MAVLLISRGSMSGGQIVAQSLSHTAQFRCVTREDLIASVNAHGEIANRVTESIPKAAQAYGSFSEVRRPYKVLMRLALLEYARRDKLAYFGYSGHLLIDDIAHFVRVRLHASNELRVKTTMARLRCSEEEAHDYIREVDEERIRWTRFMYGKDLRDPGLYDLCISMDRISFGTVASLLVHAVRESEFQATQDSLAELDDLYLAAHIEAALVLDPRTYDLEVGARAEKGQVRLTGPYLDGPKQSVVIEVASSVPGTESVDYAPGYAPSLAFLP